MPYVTSSASTLMNEGLTRLITRWKRSSDMPPSASGNAATTCGWNQRQNGSDRPTTFSHSRLWLSCSPDEQPEASGVRSSDELTPRS